MTRILLALTTLTACTPAEMEAWRIWYMRDPVAATEYANRPEVQAELVADWDHDGEIEPEPAAPTRTSSSPRPQDSGQSLQEAPQVSGGGGDWGKWDPILACESGGNWSISSGYYEGGLQFSPGTWDAYGGEQYAEHAYDASPSQQIEIAERVLADVGWSAWPVCSRRAGYR